MLRHHLDMNILSRVSASECEMLHIVLCVYGIVDYLCLLLPLAIHLSVCVWRNHRRFSLLHTKCPQFMIKSIIQLSERKIPNFLTFSQNRRKKAEQTRQIHPQWMKLLWIFPLKICSFLWPKGILQLVAAFPYSRMCAVLFASPGTKNTSTEIGAFPFTLGKSWRKVRATQTKMQMKCKEFP